MCYGMCVCMCACVYVCMRVCVMCLAHYMYTDVVDLYMRVCVMYQPFWRSGLVC